LQAMGCKPPHPIRYDCSLSQAGFLAYSVQLTGPSNQVTSWSELFPNVGAAARDSEACRGAIQIVRIISLQQRVGRTHRDPTQGSMVSRTI